MPCTFYFQILVMQAILNNAKRNDNFKATYHEFRTHPWKKLLQGLIVTYIVNISESLIQSKIWKIIINKKFTYLYLCFSVLSSTYQKFCFLFYWNICFSFFLPPSPFLHVKKVYSVKDSYEIFLLVLAFPLYHKYWIKIIMSLIQEWHFF